MSEENIEVVRRGYETFNRTGEFDSSLNDADVVFDNSNAMLDPDVYRGLDGLRDYSALLRGMWKSFRIEPLEFIPVGEDQVMVSMRMMMVGREDIETVARAAIIYTLNRGKISHMKSFQSKADALEAAGLPEP